MGWDNLHTPTKRRNLMSLLILIDSKSGMIVVKNDNIQEFLYLKCRWEWMNFSATWAAPRKTWNIQTWTGIRILTSAVPVQCSRTRWSKFIHSDPHFKYKNSSIIIIYLYIYGLIIDPHDDQLPVGPIAQLVEHWIDNAEVRVRISVQGPVSRKSRKLFRPEKPFVRLWPANSVKVVF